MRSMRTNLLLLLSLLLVVGCSPTTTSDPIQIMIDEENVGWEVIAVHPQKTGILVQVRGRRDPKRHLYVVEDTTVKVEVGEIWIVKYQKFSNPDSYKFVLRSRLYTKEEAHPLRQ